MAKKKTDMSKEIVVSDGQYPALRGDTSVIESMAEMGISIFDLPRMKVPSGGMTAWEIVGLKGSEYLKERDVVILASRSGQRAWYRDQISGGGGSPPDCVSADGLTGVGSNSIDPAAKPGKHECIECPWNQFGSRRSGGGGKDCKEFSQILVATVDGEVPTLVVIPPTSLKALKQYYMALLAARKKPSQVVTRLALERVQGSGPEYSRITFAYLRDCDADQQVVANIADRLKTALFKVNTVDSAQAL